MKVEVSNGELLDKQSILELKLKNIKVINQQKRFFHLNLILKIDAI